MNKNKKNLLQPIRWLMPLIIAAIVIIIAWIIGKGALTLVSSAKQM